MYILYMFLFNLLYVLHAHYNMVQTTEEQQRNAYVCKCNNCYYTVNIFHFFSWKVLYWPSKWILTVSTVDIFSSRTQNFSLCYVLTLRWVCCQRQIHFHESHRLDRVTWLIGAKLGWFMDSSLFPHVPKLSSNFQKVFIRS